MKKIIITLIVSILLIGCSSDKKIMGKNITTYGIFNEDELKCENINYDASIGNAVWSVILFVTIFAPISLIGYDLFEPISVIDSTKNIVCNGHEGKHE